MVKRTNLAFVYVFKSLWLICAGITCASCTGSDASYILQVQLHNYTNLHGAYYNPVNKLACCCQSLLPPTPACQQKAENLKCIGDVCQTTFEFCIEGRCSQYPQSYLTDVDTFNGVAFEDGVTIYSTIEHRGTIKIKESINFVIKAFYNSSTILNQNGEVHLIDNFSIPLELKPVNYFSSPIDINGTFDIGSFTIAYRIQCDANYYGPDCSVLCRAHNSKSAGHYTCDINGGKICKDGYTNPLNDCKDAVSVSTSTASSGVTLSSCPANTSTITTTKTTTLTCDLTSTALVSRSDSCIASLVASVNAFRDNNTVSSACDDREAFVAVLTMLLLTYVGIAIFIIIKLWFHLKTQRKLAYENIVTTSRDAHRILDNPNYEDLSPSTRMTSSHQDQMAISENIYAPLTTNQFPMAVDDSEQTRQYDIIDSNSSSMYALIED